MEAKHCKSCDAVKPTGEFYRNKARKDGLAVYCRPCERSRNNGDPKRLKAFREDHAKKADLRKAKQKEYRQGKGRGVKNACVARRIYAKKLRTVSWANDQLIDAYYKEARRLEELTGIQFHVDHIIPLQGELVSGLHVETNLQLLPAQENMGKSNSFDPMTFCA